MLAPLSASSVILLRSRPWLEPYAVALLTRAGVYNTDRGVFFEGYLLPKTGEDCHVWVVYTTSPTPLCGALFVRVSDYHKDKVLLGAVIQRDVFLLDKRLKTVYTCYVNPYSAVPVRKRS